MEYLLTFKSQFFAVKLKKELKKQKIKFKLKPVPSELSNDCAVCGIINISGIKNLDCSFNGVVNIFEIKNDKYLKLNI